MIHGCDDGGVMMVALLFEAVSYMAREKIISYYCAMAHTLLKPELRFYRLRTT